MEQENLNWEFIDAGQMIKSPNEWVWDEQWDGRFASPDNHHVLFENESVRVIEVSILPGAKEKLHTHPCPSLMIIDSPVNMRYYGADGNVKFERSFTPDQIRQTNISWREPEGLHAIENIDERTMHGIRIELLYAAK